ncbi:hypothetical protein FGM00_02440 [Aggregatimonas sangjinii]|uniref:DUF4846 domain-containing protein n=1 Tax=Aggregatimonas sangjinii TaxID=2583587 RepID=A0A5B7SPX6_9FLAO|nr:DUF4846 domain-containing protein [Aggregatimonas sangjinii]QCW99030.1 hypothetical protein FGM00_02440 [Aggregatimonas sangjinii]
MNKGIFYIALSFLTLTACGQQGPKSTAIPTTDTIEKKAPRINPKGNTIATRFIVPKGFVRTQIDSNSFANYLRYLPLKQDGAEVRYFDGRSKPNTNVYDAVVDLPIGNRDLHQCADAVIRLRADYLFQNKKYDSINFNFTNGFKADYANWRKGKRIVVDGNQVFWKQKAQASNSPATFWKYLEMVFSYAGTASLSKELKKVSLSEMRIGDIFIKGGFPGHAVIVVDMATDKANNEKLFLLAQSYMPAQEIQLLTNPNDGELSPWYSASAIATELRTPEWTFERSDLKRFD